MHGVRRDLLVSQAAATGIHLEEVRLSIKASNEEYEKAFENVLLRYQGQGVSRVIFGDIFLRDLRRYREENLARLGMRGIFPIWLKDTRELAYHFIKSGFRAVIVCIDPKQLDPSFCGREFDEGFLADLPASVDPCGENGEFHTFVYEAPYFRESIPIVRGEILEREGFWFCDLKPQVRSPQPIS